MKTLLGILFLTFCFSSQVMAAPACSKAYAKSAYAILKNLPIQDKTMHCTLSCDLTGKCGSVVTVGLGIAKEVYDMFGAGNAEWADLKADLKGVRISQRGLARTFQSCLKVCSGLYEP